MHDTTPVVDTLERPRQWVDEHLDGVPAALADLQLNVLEKVGDAVVAAAGAVQTASERTTRSVRHATRTVTGTARWAAGSTADTARTGGATVKGQAEAQGRNVVELVTDESARTTSRVREVARGVEKAAERTARATAEELESANVGTYSDMSRAELYDLATERNIAGRSKMNKGLLIAALRNDDER